MHGVDWGGLPSSYAACPRSLPPHPPHTSTHTLVRPCALQVAQLKLPRAKLQDLYEQVGGGGQAQAQGLMGPKGLGVPWGLGRKRGQWQGVWNGAAVAAGCSSGPGWCEHGC